MFTFCMESQNITEHRTLPFEDPVVESARELYGIPYVYPYQRFVIANILESVDQIVILPTGAGKSLCFQLPSVFLEGPTLVIYPLLSLISDQKRRLSEAGIPCEVLTGGMSGEQRSSVFTRAENGDVRLILTNPEMLLTPGIDSQLSKIGFSHIVIDEAHCISEWGDTFRPSYVELGTILSLFSGVVITAFTATASDEVVNRIAEVLFTNRPYRLVRANADRPNLFYRVIKCVSKEKTIIRLVSTLPRPLILFTRSRKEAELTALMMRMRLPEIKAYFYHAGLSREEKSNVEKLFYDSSDMILCSTSAYGMGVDKKNVRSIIHTHVPPSVEAYLQESGRAGRDGLPGTAVLVHSSDDVRHMDVLSRETDRRRYAGMLAYADSADCRRSFLLTLLGQHDEPCSGCDVCNPESESGNRDESDVHTFVQFVKRYSGKFSAADVVSILSGRATLSLYEKGYHFLPGYGALSHWTRNELFQLTEHLKYTGVLSEHVRVFERKKKRMYLYAVHKKTAVHHPARQFLSREK